MKHTRPVILLLLAPFFCAHLLAQGTSSLEWGKPIAYADFEATPVRSDTAAASISVTILLGYSASPTGALRFRVVAVMDKDQSWIKEEFRRDHILRHEQGHFDIAHIYARKLDAELGRRKYTMQDVALLNAIYDRCLAEMNELQVRYDRETRGGWDALAQSKWRTFIRDEIARW